jgi:tetratricopeptide (TPR) repeat protein
VSPPDRRAALSALDSSARQAGRLSRAVDPEESAADIIELWGSTETALRSLLGGAPFSGRELISEVRRRELISIDTAHRLVDFHAARERVNRADYQPSADDVQAARAGYESLRGALREAAPGADAITAGAAPPPVTPPSAVETPPEPVGRYPRSINRLYVFTGVAVLVLIVIGVAAALMLGRPSPAPAELAQGVAAYQAGRSSEAMTLFARAALRDPDRATTFLWMARIHRERGEWGAALRHIQRAAELEPGSADVHRELASYFLARGNSEAARAGYVRALELNPDDRSAQGWLGCALHRLGRFADAQRWAARAGAGPWMSCLQTAPPLAPQ